MSPSPLPYFLGCPSWSENAWRDYLYPADANSSEMLGYYSRVFNAVEGNTTFYARPAPGTIALGADHARTLPLHCQVPPGHKP